MGKNGLTLFEILVSIIILAMLVTGLTQVFLAAKKFAIHSRSRMAAAQMSKVFLDYLQMHVNATTWDTSSSDLNTTDTLRIPTDPTVLRYCDSDAGHTQQSGCPSAAERTLDNIIYNANYTIISEFNLRRVTLRMSWNETALY